MRTTINLLLFREPRQADKSIRSFISFEKYYGMLRLAALSESLGPIHSKYNQIGWQSKFNQGDFCVYWADFLEIRFDSLNT